MHRTLKRVASRTGAPAHFNRPVPILALRKADITHTGMQHYRPADRWCRDLLIRSAIRPGVSPIAVSAPSEATHKPSTSDRLFPD